MMSEKTASFVMHFGEMGSRWGFNRTVAQILALLVINPQPLNADDIAQALKISRGNVSMGLKELNAWQLIQVKHQAGDRKDYFTAGDFWQMAKVVLSERRKREVDPTLTLLRNHLLHPADNKDDEYAQNQIQELHDLLELLTGWANQLDRLSIEQIKSLLKLGSGISKIIDLKDKIIKPDTEQKPQ